MKGFLKLNLFPRHLCANRNYRHYVPEHTSQTSLEEKTESMLEEWNQIQLENHVKPACIFSLSKRPINVTTSINKVDNKRFQSFFLYLHAVDSFWNRMRMKGLIDYFGFGPHLGFIFWKAERLIFFINIGKVNKWELNDSKKTSEAWPSTHNPLNSENPFKFYVFFLNLLKDLDIISGWKFCAFGLEMSK